MNKLIIITIALIVSFFIQALSYAKIYRWVDKDGVTQFSTFPPDNINENFQTFSVKSKSSGKPSDYINGIWLASKDNYDYVLSIHKKGINLSRNKYGNKGYGHNVFQGSWTLSGKKFEIKYLSHNKSDNRGKKDLFYISKITENSLTLINNKTNSKTRYHRKDSRSSADLSPLMKKLVGKWTGANVKHHISFHDDGRFYIEGQFNNQFGRMYNGDWEYNDPQLLFHFKADLAVPTGRMSKSGKTETYVVKTLTDVSLIIKSNINGSIKSFIRKKKKKWKNLRTK
jgi:hypothetical protein